VLIDNVVCKGNFLECFCASDDDFTGTEDTACNLLHLMGWLKLYLHSRIPVGLKRYFENVIVPFKPIGHFHQVDVVIETEIRVNHDNPERITRNFDFQIQKDFENVNQLRDDALAVKEITTSGDLNGAVGEHFDRLGTVRVVVGQCHLIVKRRRLQLPFKTLRRCTGTLHPVRPDIFKHGTETLDVDVLDKV
jgi:hypothetical protein